jgi:hypothetical protein
MKKIFLFPLILLLSLFIQAQAVEGDGFLKLIGSNIKAPGTRSFLNGNHVKFTDDGIYSSTGAGIDMRTRHDSVMSVTLYRDNAIYGSYTGKLPKELKFDMSSSDIEKKLGKPAVAYMNSGYSEYHFGYIVLTCWFEKGVLRRVTISLKNYKL